MKPIQISITGHLRQSSQEICAELLDTARWSDFKGYSILPGIQSARFERKTPEIVGSRIAVQNTDGSSHVEEIVEWDTARRIVLRFQDFSPPLKNLAAHFIETWEFRPSPDGIEATRSMILFPMGWLGWLLLMPISRLMKKAFEANLRQANRP